MLLKWQSSYLTKVGDLQNMKVENHVHVILLVLLLQRSFQDFD
jgi:hypothetical protein